MSFKKKIFARCNLSKNERLYRYKQIRYINIMKNKLMNTALAFCAILAIAIIGCKKTETTVAPATTENVVEAQVMIDEADVAYNDIQVIGGSETEEFSSPNEGLIEVYTFVETDMDDAGFKRGLEKRFFTCLKKLELGDTPVLKLRKALRAYEECKAADIKKHREAYAALQTRTENARKEYLAQLKNGKITKAQFEAKMKELRTKYENSLKEIKQSYARTLKACYDKFMRAVKEILTERQWKAFVSCYR